MPETDRNLAYSVAERIRDVVAAKSFIVGENGVEASVTTSIGIGCYIDENDTPESLMKRADVALYEAKHTGRNRVVFEATAA